MNNYENSGVTVLATGGTIEKIYNPVKEVFMFSEDDVLAKFLKSCMFTPIEYVRVLKKDSLDMGDVDRNAIMEKLDHLKSNRVVIVHGTSTLADTASFLNDVEGLSSEKTIVLTGSLYPAELGVPESAFNLGLAVAAAKAYEHGIYVAMHGRVCLAGTIAKDPNSGEFRPISTE